MQVYMYSRLLDRMSLLHAAEGSFKCLYEVGLEEPRNESACNLI